MTMLASQAYETYHQLHTTFERATDAGHHVLACRALARIAAIDGLLTTSDVERIDVELDEQLH